MKNQVKVTKTDTHITPQGAHIVCEGMLLLIKSKSSEDIMRSNVYINSIGYTAIIVSNTEDINDEDVVLHKGELLIVKKNNGHYLSTYQCAKIEIRANLCNKVLVFPNNFSQKHLQAIIDGKIEDGDNVLIECESVEVNYVTDTWSSSGHYIGKQIKLDNKSHIKLFAAKKRDDLADRLFKLANDFAVAKEGDIAVMLHTIHNNYLKY